MPVGHWAAQAQPFFDKLPEITDYNLRIGQDFLTVLHRLSEFE